MIASENAPFINFSNESKMPDSEMTGRMFFFTATAATKPAQTAQAQLVERVAAGDADAFAELYRMYAPMVHGIILARVRRDETDDLVQEVFLSAYKNLHNLRDKSAVGGWLAMIARNRAADFYKTARPTEELSEDLREREDCRSEAREILRTIRALPEAYRETLVLRLVEGMTGPEIAERTGMTHDSVRVNLHRGMKLLKEKLGV